MSVVNPTERNSDSSLNPNRGLFVYLEAASHCVRVQCVGLIRWPQNQLKQALGEKTMDSDSDDEISPSWILTPEEMLLKGLKFAGFSNQQIRNGNARSNRERFIGQYGANPIVSAHIWEDLQTVDVYDDDEKENILPIPFDKLNPEYFLMALNFLKKYPTERDRECKFNVSHATAAKWTWYYLEKIQALKFYKIVWDEGKPDDIWIVSVDGTHCWINEPKHPTLSQDSSYYSHKYNKAGIDYELGISLSQNRLVWMSGPFPAGDSDKTVFVMTDGLRDKLRDSGKRGIADRGYAGYEELSIPNAHDDSTVSLFKSRALKRHEHFNGMTKTFECLSGRFRHSDARFANCFESVCVICQYQLEHGSPLFDILTPSMVHKFQSQQVAT